jgi:hypothetical protein
MSERAEDVAFAHDRLVAALEFYASPDTYFAIGFFPDPPCGAFMEDFSEHGDLDYADGDQRPGKRAREALQEWFALVTPEASDA